MKHRMIKTTAYALAAVLAFQGMSMTAEAAGTGSILPGGGISLKFGFTGSKLEEISTKTVIPVQSILEDISEAEAEKEKDIYKDIVVCHAPDYTAFRSQPDGKSEMLGKFYNGAVGYLINEDDDWCFISSGNAAGYVSKEYLVLGEEAIDEAKTIAVRAAVVEAENLCVREEADAESSIISVVPEGEELLVLDEADGWVKVDVEEGDGWVLSEYVDLKTEFLYGESLAEEQERLAIEKEQRRNAQIAANNKQKKGDSVTYTVGQGTEMGVAVAEYALQFVGNPYVYGGTSLTNGADCSGFVLSVYEGFGVELPHSSYEDRTQGYAVNGMENALPGDIICYSGHVALYIGNGQIVHASNSKTGIIVSDCTYRKPVAIRRIF